MNNIRRNDSESRSGIALIMVVGMLALMVVMAVAFAVFMRTERVAAGSFKTDVKARNLLQVALSRAINAIDTNMTASSRIYPNWETLQTSGGAYVTEALTKNMLDQIPLAALTPQGMCLVDGTANTLIGNVNMPNVAKGAVINMTDHSFGIVTNVVSVGGGATRVDHTSLSGGTLNTWRANDQYYFLQPSMTADLSVDQGGGRYGYVVINCSGLLDINYVGGMSRGVGTNAMEIQLQSLPEGVVINSLISERQSANFETLQELIGRGKAKGVFTGFPHHFTCYSSAITNDGRVNLGGTVADLVGRKDQIIGALTNLTCQDPSIPSTSFSLAEAGVLFTNLIDFVDSDSIPGNLGDPASLGDPSGHYVEKVPMANEIVVTNRVVFNLDRSTFPGMATNYIMSGSNLVSVEFMTPVLDPVVAGNMSWSFALEGTSGDTHVYPAQNGVFTPDTRFGGLLNLYVVRTMQLAMVGDPVPKPINLNPITCTYNAKVLTKAGPVVVDVATNAEVQLKITVSISPSGGLDGGVYTQYVGIGVGGIECIDPRLNGDSNSWISSRAYTLGTTNFAALLYLDPYTLPGARPQERNILGPPSKGKDGDTLMYVPNAPLISVGDLGYIFYGTSVNSAWETVRLFKIGANDYGKMHAVLDHFTIDNLANGVPKGRMNPNTRNTNVLNAVFEDMPVNRRHSSGVMSVLDATQLNAVETSLINRAATNSFHGLSEFGAIRWDLVNPAWNSLEKESIIRNSCGLFDVRQNFFLILLYADVTRRDLEGSLASTSPMMGVAEVWRDPLITTNDYPISIHFFQIIEAP